MTTVLIVDDSLALRERVVEMLTPVEGLQIVAQAQNASDAISSFQSLHPELVILDIQMPGGNGIEVLRRIKLEDPNTKVVILTNHSDPQYRKRCFELKADYFLSKASDSNRLIEISQNLAKHNLTGEPPEDAVNDPTTA